MPDTRKRVFEAPAHKTPKVKLETVRVIVEHDEDPDTSYLEQDEFEERLAAYQNGDFTFVGVRAEADVVIGGVSQTLTSGGLWGIESDSGKEYIEEVAGEEYSELRKILTEVGVPTAKLPQTITPRQIEWRA
jgi:hypothetical protein